MPCLVWSVFNNSFFFLFFLAYVGRVAYNCEGLILQLNLDILAKTASGIHDYGLFGMWFR
jgi:hypothetical protein